MYEDLRQKMITLCKAKHTASYPTLPVNYPGLVTVNPENRTEPWVIMSVSFEKTRRMIGSRSVIVRGSIELQYMYRAGSGSAGTSLYSDFVLAQIAMQTITGIKFEELTPYVAPLEGWEGTLNVVPFQIEYYNI